MKSSFIFLLCLCCAFRRLTLLRRSQLGLAAALLCPTQHGTAKQCAASATPCHTIRRPSAPCLCFALLRAALLRLCFALRCLAEPCVSFASPRLCHARPRCAAPCLCCATLGHTMLCAFRKGLTMPLLRDAPPGKAPRCLASPCLCYALHRTARRSRAVPRPCEGLQLMFVSKSYSISHQSNRPIPEFRHWPNPRICP